MGWKAGKWSAHAAIGVLFDGGMRSDGDGIPRIYGGGEVPRCRAEQSVTSSRLVCLLLFQCATVNLISFVKWEEGVEFSHLAGYPEGEGYWVLPYTS